MKNEDRKVLEAPMERSFSITTRAADTEARTVEIAFSSEEPYERYFGVEVLDHNPQSVRLDRLKGGAAVLVNHDTDDQVGVVESARIDGDKTGRAVIRFSKSARGEEILQDVDDGIRQLVSVGYRVHKYEVEERKGQADLVKVTDWEPFELSIVSIPADSTVGVGRSADQSETVVPPIETKKESVMDPKVDETPKAPAFDETAALNKLRTDETKRVDGIRAMADAHNLEELGRQGIKDGWTVAAFNEHALKKVGERNAAARVDTSHDGEVDLSDKDRKSFSLIKLMDAISNPNDRAAQSRAGFELEVSSEAQRGFGSEFACRGEFVPESLLGGRRALTAGTPTAAADVVGTDLMASSFIDALRNASATMNAGLTVLSGLVGNVDIPRQTSGSTSTWIGAEDGDATESDPAFDQVSLTPKDLACYTEVTRRLLQQSTPSVEMLVRNDLAIGQALGIDLAVLYGSGATGQPLGIANQTGVNSVTIVTAITYAQIVEMIALAMAANAYGGNPRFILEATGWQTLSTTPKGVGGVEGNFILGDSDLIKGRPYTMSNQVTDGDYFFGDFTQAILGEWGGLEINVDPYTHSLKGKVRYVTFKTADVACRHPEAFTYASV